MAFARDVYTASASQTDFTITFSYLQSTHVLVFVDGVAQTVGAGNDFTFFNATTIRFNTGLTGGETVIIQRASSQTVRLTDYTATTLTEADLDTDSLQGFYMAQEAIDIANTSMTRNSGDQWNGDNRRIEDVADPTAAQHVATRAYGDANWGGTAATNAAASAAAAAASASSAATEATNAANSFDQFDDRYLGSKTSDPTLDNDGNTLLTGALYFNSTSNLLKVYDGTTWNEVGVTSMSTFTYTATAGQTAFSGSDDNSNVMGFENSGVVSVTLNGIKLVEGAGNDYTLSSGTTVTLSTGAAVDDVLEVVVASAFTVAAAITQTTGDARYVRKSDTHPFRGYIDGFIVSNNGADATNDLDIGAGSLINGSGEHVELASAITKRADATWAEGTNQGGMFSGATAFAADNTWHVFVITKDSDSTVDVGFDSSETGANVPAGWTIERRIASMRTKVGSAAWREFTQYPGGKFFYNEVTNTDNRTTMTSVSSTATAPSSHVLTGAPTGVRLGLIGNHYHDENGTNAIRSLYLFHGDFDGSDGIAGFSSHAGFGWRDQNGSGSVRDLSMGFTDLWCDTSAQVKAYTTSIPDSAYVFINGWYDPRGRDE